MWTIIPANVYEGSIELENLHFASPYEITDLINSYQLALKKPGERWMKNALTREISLISLHVSKKGAARQLSSKCGTFTNRKCCL